MCDLNINGHVEERMKEIKKVNDKIGQDRAETNIKIPKVIYTTEVNTNTKTDIYLITGINRYGKCPYIEVNQRKHKNEIKMRKSY